MIDAVESGLIFDVLMIAAIGAVTLIIWISDKMDNGKED